MSRRKRSKQRCRTSGKVIFYTEAAALVAIARGQSWRHGTSTNAYRAYPCPHCRHWHLSSKPRREPQP
ncbi:hypothetical protein [Deinococcus radiophilus]|uniref:hypothetical protein n=1 Tax=Deinococcus radiophilus TaxID=32062 RepID=UPI001E366F6D|nr:hypothetical protein [Deinococcus radiophilus]UFA49636.1 hypothetical protein LMT64_06940 [Deinococcus radiophilus]